MKIVLSIFFTFLFTITFFFILNIGYSDISSMRLLSISFVLGMFFERLTQILIELEKKNDEKSRQQK